MICFFRVIFAAVVIVQLVSSSQIRSLSGLQFKFKGLIGLPEFLKLHVMVGFDDLSTSRRYLLDFLPIDAANPDVIAKLIAGKSMPGEIRIKREDITMEIYKVNNIRGIASDIPTSHSRNEVKGGVQEVFQGERYVDMLTADFDPTINLYRNNCYNFALHCIAIDKEIRAAI